ncbi:MAG: hypothetical protein IKO80_08795, partial [Lachnospiraceae bacterium]|nr:hypothetical protein [Lachnospiraceae bacterium]
SNVTYRIYDYDRRDAKGRPRDLHISQALDVTRLTRPVITDHSPHLVACPYFTVDRVCAGEKSDACAAGVSVGADVPAEAAVSGAAGVSSGADTCAAGAMSGAAGAVTGTVVETSFLSVRIIGGEGTLSLPDTGGTYPCRPGDSFFLPASSGSWTLTGTAEALLTRVP